MLTGPVAEILRTHRAHFNARFHAAKNRWPHLDAADFSLFLRDQFSPALSAVAATAPDLATHSTHLAYDLALQLVAEKLAGPSARDPLINTLWSSALPPLAALFAREPQRLIGGLVNIAHHLTSTAQARADFWLSQLVALGPRSTDGNQLIRLAQILAWRAGLAHLRASALHSASSMPPALALAVVGAPPSSVWSQVLSDHLQNPWYGFSPDGQLLDLPTEPRRIGAFRGFGGLFSTPPLVGTSGEHILIRSGEDSWLLIADAFGATLHRADANESAAMTAPGTKSLTATLRRQIPAGQAPTSCALTPHSFAFTTAQSHAVFVGPRPKS